MCNSQTRAERPLTTIPHQFGWSQPLKVYRCAQDAAFDQLQAQMGLGFHHTRDLLIATSQLLRMTHDLESIEAQLRAATPGQKQHQQLRPDAHADSADGTGPAAQSTESCAQGQDMALDVACADAELNDAMQGLLIDAAVTNGQGSGQALADIPVQRLLGDATDQLNAQQEIASRGHMSGGTTDRQSVDNGDLASLDSDVSVDSYGEPVQHS